MHEVQQSGLRLRTPAQYGRQVVRTRAIQVLVALAVFIVVTVVAGATAGWLSPTFAGAELATLAFMWAVEHYVMPDVDRREQGNNGEVKVGRILEELADEGWRVLHDVQSDRGNIDHLLVGPAGILTVETKRRQGRVNVAALDERWLRQAYAQRKRIERITGQPVDALLVFSDAYLDRPVSRQRGVCVLPARMLRGHLARRTARLTPEEVESTFGRLARVLST
jgi:hypothetical protein